MAMGPLHDIRVIELAGIGPVPFCGMLLSDMGADVIRVDRVSGGSGSLPGPLPTLVARGRRSIAVDLKSAAGTDLVLQLIETADVLIEGYRPGVVERLGLGPEVCHARNPGLVYGRMTGWGQTGPLAETAGHDINYLSLTGALHSIGRAGDRPTPPLNLVADYGGGALYLAVGVLAALVNRASSGRGEIVDAAMCDGAASLMTMIYQMRAAGLWRDERGTNLLDGMAPFYDTYTTADGRWMAVGALEPQFFAELVAGLGLSEGEIPVQYDVDGWPEMRRLFTEAFASRSRAEWEEVFAGSDACVTPVLSMDEVPHSPHVAHRGGFVEVGGFLEPGPAPRFAFARADPPVPPAVAGTDTDAILEGLGLSASEIDALEQAGVVEKAT